MDSDTRVCKRIAECGVNLKLYRTVDEAFCARYVSLSGKKALHKWSCLQLRVDRTEAVRAVLMPVCVCVCVLFIVTY